MIRPPSLAADRRQRRTLIALIAAAAAVAMLLLGHQLWSSYTEALRGASTATQNYVAIIEARLDATLRRTDGVLQTLTREVPLEAMSQQAVPRFAPSVNADLDRDMVNFAELAGLRVFDAHGALLYSSAAARAPRATIADRRYFRRLRDDPQAGLVFSEVVPITSIGRQGVVAARALRDRQGAFAGVVLAVIELEYFKRLFQSLDVGPAGVLAIRRSDDFSGVVRWPMLEREINRPLPPDNPARAAMQAGQRVGTLEYPASSDGVVRTYSFRSIEGYPFLVVAALARDDALAGWRARSLAVGAAGLLLLALLAGLMARLWRLEAREARAVAALADSEERLRLANAQLEARVQQRTAELVRARDEAERASHAKSDFLSAMSHELRTPMNAILGFGQLLELDVKPQPPSSKHKLYAREILQAGRHLLELIDDLLDLARIEAGKQPLHLEPVPVAALIQECLNLVEPIAREHEVRAAAEPDTTAGWVSADRTRLKQVLLNLLSNAIKYNRQGGRVRVACSDDGDCVRISVADTGRGIDPQQQQHLFKWFERLGAERTTIQGAGIGLVLSQRLIERMHGQIGIDSEIGVGSTFWIRLPRATAAPQAGAPPALPPACEIECQESVRTVLYIEDNAANVTLMEAVLAQQPGVRLISAPLPGLGLDMARTRRPDLILLDIQLPGMDGYQVLDRLRESAATADIPVIAISANAMTDDVERGRAAGFVDYLTKPLNVANLVATIRKTLRLTGPRLA